MTLKQKLLNEQSELDSLITKCKQKYQNSIKETNTDITNLNNNNEYLYKSDEVICKVSIDDVLVTMLEDVEKTHHDIQQIRFQEIDDVKHILDRVNFEDE